ncbi:hypothetical protein N7450_001799 [Penicillium hetheringtonii]|uniref:Uncharacterized protein n=1 Tax=Penicillium hetheringtonii TaxID=911720 RepID=A0AAD6E4Y6_9EURO|nr:hypothetical protein N7450_001799 [Penicillium hetheringtonii]
MKASHLCVAITFLWNTALASRLYAASYGGSVYSLDLKVHEGSPGISALSISKDCGSSPSWLMFDKENNILYCLNEAIGAPNGSITSFKSHSNGSLQTIQRLNTTAGPVMSNLYSAPGVIGHDFFAVAHYETSTVSTCSVNRTNGHFEKLQEFTYSMPGPGPNAARQDAPHPHGVTVDPTGQYVLVPDLGADIIRIYHINPMNGYLRPLEPFIASPGSGPRHGVFWTPKGPISTDSDVYFYLVHELSNTLTGYRVSYNKHGMAFSRVFEGSTYGNHTAPSGSKTAEISITPRNSHIVVSNRLDNSFGQKNDSIAIFSCADTHGRLFDEVRFVGLFPAYGSSLRSFDIGATPETMALALEKSQSVAVASWNDRKEVPGNLLATKKLDGDVPMVVWGV